MDLERFKEITTRSLSVTDALGLHREAITIPLEFDDDCGRVELQSPGKLEIVGPAQGSIDDFIAALPEMISGLNLSSIPRAET